MSKVLVYVDKGVELTHERDNSVYIAKALSKNHSVTLRDSLPEDFVSYDAVFLRKDMPKEYYVDIQFPDNMVTINDPHHMRYFDSKLSLVDFAFATPDSIVADSKESVYDFLDSHPKCVLKPSFSYGGKGITIVDRKSSDKELDSYFQSWGKSLCQEFLPGVSKGDKRIIVIDGEPVSALLRKSNGGLCNTSSGGSTEASEISPLERKVCEELAPHLLDKGQLIVGLDFIDEKLSEINVSSVGLLRRADIYNKNLNSYAAIQRLGGKYL